MREKTENEDTQNGSRVPVLARDRNPHGGGGQEMINRRQSGKYSVILQSR